MRESSTGTSVDGDLAAAGVEADRADAEHLFVVFGHGDPAPQHGPHAGHELAEPEGLGHVVAGAELEPEDDVDLGVARRDHDDRHGLEAAHLLADLDAGLVGEHHVEQDEVGVDAVEEAQCLVPVAGRLDGEALAGQARRQRLAIGLLVVDHEHEWSVVPGRAGRWGPAARRRCVCDCHAVVRPQAASWGTGGVRNGRRAGDDGGRGVDRTDVAWARGEAKTRAMVTNDPKRPLRCEGDGRIMMTSARCSWPR